MVSEREDEQEAESNSFICRHTLVSESRLRIRAHSSKCPDDLHVQRMLILVLRVF